MIWIPQFKRYVQFIFHIYVDLQANSTSTSFQKDSIIIVLYMANAQGGSDAVKPRSHPGR
jgi:hypothetical protein